MPVPGTRHGRWSDWQVYLTNDRKLAPSSICIAVSALRFLYTVTLKKAWRVEAVIPAPKKPQTLPVVLSPAEVVQFLDSVTLPKHRTILTTCYAAGLRISEAVRLTASAIDSQRMVLRIALGKGQKDRYVMLSPKLLEILRTWWQRTRPTHWLFPGDRPDRPIGRAAVERQCHLVGPDLLGTQGVRRLPEVPSEPGDTLHVCPLGMRRELPHLHVFEQASSKDCHGTLLCEGAWGIPGVCKAAYGEENGSPAG